MGKKSETFIKSINYILKGILEIIYPRTNNVNPNPRQYKRMLTATKAGFPELTSNAKSEIKYPL